MRNKRRLTDKKTRRNRAAGFLGIIIKFFYLKGSRFSRLKAFGAPSAHFIKMVEKNQMNLLQLILGAEVFSVLTGRRPRDLVKNAVEIHLVVVAEFECDLFDRLVRFH